jgi:hypothetical protein
VTSINGLGVDVNDWPTTDESVSSMTFNSLATVDPLVRCPDTHAACGRVCAFAPAERR